MLVRSIHDGWDVLRAIVEEGPFYRLVGDTSSGASAVAIAGRVYPEAVLFPVRLSDMSAAYLAAQLRHVSPAAALVVVGHGRDDSALADLAEAGADAILPWRQVTPLGVVCWLMPILQLDDVQVAPAPVVQRLAGLRHQSRQAAAERLRVTERELKVLDALAAGLSRGKIAQEQGLSDRQVRREVADLERKLDAGVVLELMAKAAEVGLLGEGWPQ